MSDPNELTQTPGLDPAEDSDQDSEPPGDGIDGPVHPDDPAEGPDSAGTVPA